MWMDDLYSNFSRWCCIYSLTDLSTLRPLFMGDPNIGSVTAGNTSKDGILFYFKNDFCKSQIFIKRNVYLILSYKSKPWRKLADGACALLLGSEGNVRVQLIY